MKKFLFLASLFIVQGVPVSRESHASRVKQRLQKLQSPTQSTPRSPAGAAGINDKAIRAFSYLLESADTQRFHPRFDAAYAAYTRLVAANPGDATLCVLLEKAASSVGVLRLDELLLDSPLGVAAWVGVAPDGRAFSVLMNDATATAIAGDFRAALPLFLDGLRASATPQELFTAWRSIGLTYLRL